jgi:hypothetical protein
MPMKFSPTFKSILEEFGHQALIFRKCYQTLADVTGWEHLEFVSQPSRAASVVCHRHDCCEFVNRVRELPISRFYTGLTNMLLQSGEQL